MVATELMNLNSFLIKNCGGVMEKNDALALAVKVLNGQVPAVFSEILKMQHGALVFDEPLLNNDKEVQKRLREVPTAASLHF